MNAQTVMERRPLDLTPEEQLLNQQDYELCQRVASNDPEAVEEFVGKYQGLTAFIGEKVCGPVRTGIVDPDDMSQEAMLIFLNQATTYRPDIGPRFHTYASIKIREQLAGRRREQENTVHVPIDVQQALGKVDKANNTRMQQGRPPMDVQDVSEMTGFPVRGGGKIRSVRTLHQAQLLTKYLGSIDGGFNPHQDTAPGEAYFLDKGSRVTSVTDPEPVSVEDMVVQKVSGEELVKIVRDNLPPREADIVMRTHGLGAYEPQTFDTIAADYGVSRTRIHQIHNRIMKRIHDSAPLKAKFAAFLLRAAE